MPSLSDVSALVGATAALVTTVRLWRAGNAPSPPPLPRERDTRP